MSDTNDADIELIAAGDYDEFADEGDRFTRPYDDVFVDGELLPPLSIFDDESALRDPTPDI
jgi:hypothetical protein